MGYPYVVEGGGTPMIIGAGGTEKDSSWGGSGGGVFVIILFLLIIAVVAMPFLSRREAVVQPTSSLAEILPAMMVMQSTQQRQTVDVNSHNSYGSGAGPTNFQLYQQGVQTDRDVLKEGCDTRQKVSEEAALTRAEVAAVERRTIERELQDAKATIIQKDNQLISAAQFASLQAQNVGIVNEFTQQINALASVVCKEPVNARVVDSTYPQAARIVDDCCGYRR